MEFKVKRVENIADMEQVFTLRKRVFIEEQGVDPDLEWDEADKKAVHVMAHSGKKVIGCGRINFSGNKGKIGRVAVDRDFRKKGVGSAVCRQLMNIAAERKGCEKLVLHAQVEAAEFYHKLGFTSVGDTFMEAGIEHIKMEREI